MYLITIDGRPTGRAVRDTAVPVTVGRQDYMLIRCGDEIASVALAPDEEAIHIPDDDVRPDECAQMLGGGGRRYDKALKRLVDEAPLSVKEIATARVDHERADERQTERRGNE